MAQREEGVAEVPIELDDPAADADVDPRTNVAMLAAAVRAPDSDMRDGGDE